MDDPGMDADETVGQIIGLAGPRPAPSPERAARVRATVHSAWRTSRRRRSARRLALLAAAGLAALAVVWARGPRTAPEAVAVARLESVTGAIETREAEGWRRLGQGAELHAGSLVRTAGGARAGFRLEGGAALRLDADSSLRWQAPGSVALERGACYVDSGPDPSTTPLAIETPWGTVREVGTQFEVRLEPAAVRVRVREGRVVLVRDGCEHPAPSGLELRVGADGESRRPIPVHGAEWAWVAAAGPGFAIEGRPLRAFLGWLCRENGWTLRFADAESERLAGTILLHGTIDGLAPEEALAVVLPTTALPHRLDDGLLVVGGAADDAR